MDKKNKTYPIKVSQKFPKKNLRKPTQNRLTRISYYIKLLNVLVECVLASNK